MQNAHSVSLRQKYDECEGAAKLRMRNLSRRDR
jgi:hypothetical protein